MIMPEQSIAERERSVLTTLEQLSADRARDELETDRVFRYRQEKEEKTYQANRNRIVTTGRADTNAIKAKHQSVRAEISQKAVAEEKSLEAEFAETRKAAINRSNAARNSAKKRLEETRWQALALFESGKDGAIKQYKLHETELKDAIEALEELKTDASPVLLRIRRFVPSQTVEPSAPAEPIEKPIEALRACIEQGGERLAPLAGLFLPRVLMPQVFPWPFLLLAGLLSYWLNRSLGWSWGWGIGTGLGIAVLAAVGTFLGLGTIARAQVAGAYPLLSGTLSQADRLVEMSRQWIKTTFENTKDEVERTRQRDVDSADERHLQAIAEAEAVRERKLREADEKYPPLLRAVAERRDAALKETDEIYPRRLQEIQERFQRESAQLDEEQSKKKETTERLHAEAWESLVKRWSEGLASVHRVVESVQADSDRLFLDWNHADLDAWVPPRTVPTGMKFGTLTIDLANIPNGLPTNARLKPFGPTRHEVPALTPFPRVGSVLIKAADAGRAEAVSLLQTLMLRYLTSLPPGKVRFTIIDPVGLGENFAGFMHLSEYSELLVTSRIWTETPQIEQRLVDLSAHMENVIQKYLRNEFETIEEYNAFAGEVAEPFRILVVANFPTNFSEGAARRLVSIASTGARCGVFTLISIDTKQQLPTGVHLKDLESHCVNFQWREGVLQWRDRELGQLPLRYDLPPAPDRFTRLMHTVGELARNANRVEVPFEFIAPGPEQYWTADSRAGIDIPLGRAGATKLQHLRLGKGTSQHVLIAGKTGSGKSTLLHALITNAALRYSPDELELYLIDFKKGVEFKVYATMELPHARVIAVESEREFGLSVLQRLDEELKARGDRFRDLGVQDLNSYRDADGGKNPLPRVLFIVDEFQEFFVEDDKIAQEVALLLDRLVRQGRAFGIHVHLGSQSLGGAYSLARSTIGQMAVRIALQCSESDAHLILSEENSAARLLTRPGEAIYNDQNGMVEGNNFFQVVWLTDERREEYLRAIRDLARTQGRPPSAQIVFEGNLPAIPSKNHLLANLLETSTWPAPPAADLAWLGEAIAIKDPTVAVFRPQSGSNLLIIGQNEAMALGILQMALLALSAQQSPAGVQFFVFDGSPVDSTLNGRLGQIRDRVPHLVREVVPRELAEVLELLAAEVERRQKGEAGEAPHLYLIIHDLQRFRDLRKSDDDFGFGRYGEPKTEPPSKLFAQILREGPPLGIHTLLWCDSLNNLNRTFDRQSLREFELRVLFQMSANDSSSLIDLPAASRLGPNRALFFSEEEGRLEKFRPYGIPSEEWLAEVSKRLASRPGQPAVSIAIASDGHLETSGEPEAGPSSGPSEFGSPVTGP
ncbi:MAG: FtsK/SpoIIIE domain-containing protein [Isosphaeraceae bacterium]